MTIEQFRKAYSTQPFRPFVIHMATGSAIPVEHQEFIMASPSGRTVIVAQPDDTVDIIDLLHVTHLEVKPPRNGKRGSARRNK